MTGLANKIGNFIETFARDRRGATAIEYGLIAAGIFLAIVLSVYNLASNLHVMYGTVSSTVVKYVL